MTSSKGNKVDTGMTGILSIKRTVFKSSVKIK